MKKFTGAFLFEKPGESREDRKMSGKIENGDDPRQDWLDGARTMTVLFPATLPFGMIAGLTAAKAGFGPALGVGHSTAIFAGASQIAMLQLMMEGALPVVATLTVLLINLRFAMYSAALSQQLRGLTNPQKWLAAYLLTDQAYALSELHFARNPEMTAASRFRFYIASGLSLWVVWMISTALGYYLGAGLPPEWGLEFGVPLTFIALLVPGLRDRALVVAACVSGTVACAAISLPYNLGLFLAALTGIAGGCLYEARIAPRKEETP